MTNLQIAYAQALEAQRSHIAQESESKRHNLAMERLENVQNVLAAEQFAEIQKYNKKNYKLAKKESKAKVKNINADTKLKGAQTTDTKANTEYTYFKIDIGGKQYKIALRKVAAEERTAAAKEAAVKVAQYVAEANAQLGKERLQFDKDLAAQTLSSNIRFNYDKLQWEWDIAQYKGDTSKHLTEVNNTAAYLRKLMDTNLGKYIADTSNATKKSIAKIQSKTTKSVAKLQELFGFIKNDKNIAQKDRKAILDFISSIIGTASGFASNLGSMAGAIGKIGF